MSDNNKKLNTETKSDSKDSSSSTAKVGSTVEVLNFIIQVIHTLVRFLPLGLYFFTYFSASLFKDIRSAILLIGLILNDIIGYLYKKYNNHRPRQPCAIFVSPKDKEPGFLPNPHTEIMSFVASFL